MKQETFNPSQESSIQRLRTTEASNFDFSIQVQDLSKRFNREWIFKNINYTFKAGRTYAITGPNGSGKSTLLQVLWGQLPQTSGSITYLQENKHIAIEEIFNHVSIATPYMDLIEEFTLEEQIRFHFRMRAMRDGQTLETILDNLYLKPAKAKHISNFSSGMRQRLKLGLAFFTESRVLFLDEPGTNLDEQALNWYLENLHQLPSTQLIFIATNQSNEYPKNAEVINVMEFK